MSSDNMEFQRSVVSAMGLRETVDRNCSIHGDYAADIMKLGRRDHEMPCPACFEIQKEEHDKAELDRMDRDRRDAKIAASKRRLEQRTGAAMIPKRFVGKTFADYKAENKGQQRVLDACADYANNFADNLDAGRCLILSGKVGTGKTHLAAAIADHLINKTDHSVVFRSLFSILQAIKNTYSEQSEYTEAQIHEALSSPDLLIIDEIGATKSSEFELSTLFALINARYENKLPTVIITNLEAHQLKESIGDRCVDRLREGGGRALMFDWDSERAGI